MNIKLLTFGIITEILDDDIISFETIKNTDDLILYLEKKYPNIKNLHYKISINQEIINSNTSLKNNDEIAILPPFAGG